MIAASPVPSIVAGLVSRARRKIASHFFFASRDQRRGCGGLCAPERYRAAPVRADAAHGRDPRGGEGRYWIDTAAYQAQLDARRRVLVPIVIVLSVVIAGLILLGYRG